MNRISILFLQAVIILIGMAAIAILIRAPLSEGRAANLDLFSIYFDPFLLYAYATSIACFVALYKAFKFLGYIGQNKVFTSNAVNCIKDIRYCAIALGILIVVAGIYIKIFHHKDDDPAGFLAICMVTAFLSIVVATATGLFETILQNVIDRKSEKGFSH